MEFKEAEIKVIEETLNQRTAERISELGELQLLLIGGGIGDTII